LDGQLMLESVQRLLIRHQDLLILHLLDWPTYTIRIRNAVKLLAFSRIEVELIKLSYRTRILFLETIRRVEQRGTAETMRDGERD
jgi:hypothetical protein